MRRSPFALVLAPLLILALAACGASSSPGGSQDDGQDGVVVTPDPVQLVEGGTATLSAVVNDGAGAQDVTWSSADPNVATVDASGVVTGVSVGGPIDVTATSSADPDLSGSASVTVVSADCVEPEPLGDVAAARTLSPLTHHDSCTDYLVSGHILVDADLTVEPGVVIAFEDDASMTVRAEGSLNAVGTADRGIAFVGTERQPGHWEAVVLHSNDTANELRHVTIRDSGAGERFGTSAQQQAGLIVANGAQVAIRDSALRDNQGNGLRLREGAVVRAFSDNLFSGNTGAPLRLASNQLGFLDDASDYAGATASANGSAYVYVDASTTVAGQDWPAANLPYRFHGHHFIETEDDTAGVTLAAGATVEFASEAGLRVDNGFLRAVGTEDDRITFTGAVRTDTGYWEALVFHSNNPDNTLSYVDVAYGGAGARFGFSAQQPASVIVAADAQLGVSHSTFSGGGTYGLLLREGARLNAFHDNAFEANGGAPLLLHSSQLGFLGANNRYRGAGDEANGAQYIHVAASDTSGGATPSWPATDLPYRFHEHHRVLDADVTIAAGAELEFASGASLRVNEPGSLAAVGTDTEPIVFTGAIETAGYWEALVFASNDPANVLEHVEVAYGGAGDRFGTSANIPANIIVWDGAQATLRDSVVRDAPQCYGGGGILTLDGGNTFTDCTRP